MARKKTTVSIDEDLLRAAKVAAAREGKPDYVIFEEALRERLGFGAIERLQRLLVPYTREMSEDEVMDLAVRATKNARAKIAAERAAKA